MSSAGTAYVDVEAKLESFAAQIEAAVAALDTQTLAVDADTSDAEAAITAISDDQLSLFVDADTTPAEGEIDAIDGGEPVEKKVEADTAEAQKNIDDLSGSINAAADAAGAGAGQLGGLISEIGGLTGASAGATAGLTAAVGGLLVIGNAAGDAQAVVAETDSIIGSLGESAVVTSGHIGELSTKVMEYSGFSDEAVRAGANTLLMFDNINNAEVFDRAIEGSADLARRMGTDVPQAARLLGRALQDPEQGMSRLQRAGIYLSDTQKEQVASFMAVGDTASAQDVILSSLEGRIGNLAEDYGSTMKGGMDQAREAMDELAESAGSSLLPMMEALSASVVDQVNRLQSWDSALNGALFSGPIQAIAGIGDGMRGIGTIVGELPGTLDASAAATQAFGEAAGQTKDEIDGLSNTLRSYLDGTFGLPEAQRGLRDSFDQLFQVLLTEGHTADDVAAAMEQIAYKTADVGAASGDMNVAADLTIQRLRGMRDAGQLTTTEFNRIRDAIRGAQDEAPLTVPTSAPGATAATNEIKGLGDAVRKLPPERIVGVRAEGAAEATRAVSEFKRQLDALPKNVFVGVSTTGSAKASARGGPLDAGELSLVGEQGPELFVPNTGGNIVPAMQTASLMMGAGATYNINVNAATGDGHELARIIRDEIRTLERAGR